MFLTGQHISHLPEASSTHSEALQYLYKQFCLQLCSQPSMVLYTFSFFAFVVAPHLGGLCSAWVRFLGVLCSCTLLLHWEMPNPLLLRNVHGRKDSGFEKNIAWRSRPVHSLRFRSGALLWSHPTNVRSELVPVSDLTMFWFEETRQCFFDFFFIYFFFPWQKLNLSSLRGNILTMWNSFCDMKWCDW